MTRIIFVLHNIIDKFIFTSRSNTAFLQGNTAKIGLISVGHPIRRIVGMRSGSAILGAMIAFFCIFNFSAHAQVQIPELDCVKGDTIVWTLQPEPCGDFIALDIYYATDRMGPYTLITSIMDEMEDFFVHNVTAPLRFYYLIARYDCPGGTSMPSDTLNNRPPDPVRLNFITVENGGVRLDWQPSLSPQTEAYIIYRVTNQGTVPIDTIFSGTSYFDPNSNPDDKSEFYYVLAMDACETRGGFDIAHNTVFLDVTQDECTREAYLSWNEYNFWPNGYDEWEILVSIDGASPVLAGMSPAEETEFTYEGLEDNRQYCFTIQVTETGTGNVSLSNEICFTASVIDPNPGICMQMVNTDNPDAITIEYDFPNPIRPNLEYIRILRGNSPDNISTVLSDQQMPDVFQTPYTFTDNDIDASREVVYYQIETLDLCGDIVRSNIISNLLLTGQALPGRQNQLFWNAFYFEDSVFDRYELYRIDGSNRQFITSGTELDTSFIDQISGPSVGSTVFCYQLVAIANADCDDSGIERVHASNVHCVEQNSTILAPNALVVGGVNNFFKPVILYPESINDYHIKIYDRYGGVVFESSDPDQGWDGRKNGRGLPLGVYHYIILATQNNGRVIEETGAVALIR